MTNPTSVGVLAALVMLPAVTGAALLLGGRRADRVAAPLAVAVASVVAALAVVAAATRPAVSAPFLRVDGGDLALAVDGLSAVLVVTVGLVAAAVTVFAAADLDRDDARARFFGYLLLFTGAMLATVTATTLPALLLAWELMGATSYVLIGFRWDLPGKLASGATAFLATRAGDLGLYVAAGATLAGTGSLALDGLATADGRWRDVAAAGILLAALGKSAQLPFSAWLSRAMAGPSPVSALLHSATMVAAGGYLLLRTRPLLEATTWAAATAAWVGALTALVLGAVACGQGDLKQLLAASTAAQIGFVVLAAGVGTTAGGTAQLVAHAAVKAGLFVAAGAWLTSLGTKQLAGLRGVARRHPGTGAAAVVACLALAGVPPLSLWATKDEVLAGVDGTALRVVTLAAAALSAVYAGRVLVVILSRPDPAAPPTGRAVLDVEQPGTRRVPPAATGVAAILAVVAAGLGSLALPAVADALKAVLGAEGQPSPSAAELVLSGLLAVVVLALTGWRPLLAATAVRTPLAGWAGLDRLLSPHPVLAVARAAAAIDTRVVDRSVWAVAGGARRLAAVAAGADRVVVDGSVRATAVGTRRLAALAARADRDLVDGAVRATATATRRAGAAARRPQTGLLHQYYTQALVGLGALLVLLLVVR